jgi:hypothetical protein
MLAATGRAIRLIDEDIVAAVGAHHAVDCLAELLVPRIAGGVLAAGKRPAYCHADIPDRSRSETLMVAATGASAAAGWSGAAGASRSLVAISRRGEHRKLHRLLPAFALRASHLGALVHDDALVSLAAIVAKVFVNRHFRSLSAGCPAAIVCHGQARYFLGGYLSSAFLTILSSFPSILLGSDFSSLEIPRHTSERVVGSRKSITSVPSA